MALKDVRKYYSSITEQYLVNKENLACYEQMLKDGQITEERMEAVKDKVYKLQQNFERIAYIMYLFGLPNNNKKKAKAQASKADKGLNKTMDLLGASKTWIDDENRSIVADVKAELEKLASEKKVDIEK